MHRLFYKKSSIKLCLSRSKIHVWKIYLDYTRSETKNHSDLLSEQEYKKLNSFQFQKDRFCYSITHCMKRRILAHYLNESPEKLNFTLNKQGKPSISERQNWLNIQFNISHSYQFILMALTIKDPIGIDIEYHDKNTPIDTVSKFICSPSEKHFLDKLPNQQEKTKAFFRCWTRKEAYLKATGFGLSDSLFNLSVDINEIPKNNWLKISKGKKEKNVAWKLFPLNIHKHYSAAIVCANYLKHLLLYSVEGD